MRIYGLVFNRGYTIFELMVTIVIVSVLATVIGTSFVKLLTIQENDREEAYIREKLADICAIYADFLSVGSSISTNDQETLVRYRQETGGVSLETGRVSRVAYMTSYVDKHNGMTGRTLHLKVFSNDDGETRENFSRGHNAEALLLPQIGKLPEIVSCSLTLLEADATICQALGYLKIAAKYEVERDNGVIINKTVTAGRIVRLWNRE